MGWGLFSSGPKECPREELFGDSAGKASTTIAKHIPGASMANLQSKSISSGSEISKAKMAAIERGQKLNELEDRTEQMANEAKQYATTANSLLHKYKDKKWYQLYFIHLNERNTCYMHVRMNVMKQENA